MLVFFSPCLSLAHHLIVVLSRERSRSKASANNRSVCLPLCVLEHPSEALAYPIMLLFSVRTAHQALCMCSPLCSENMAQKPSSPHSYRAISFHLTRRVIIWPCFFLSPSYMSSAYEVNTQSPRRYMAEILPHSNRVSRVPRPATYPIFSPSSTHPPRLHRSLSLI